MAPLSEVLPVLASWRRKERDRSATAAWRYRVTWVPVPDQGPAALSGTWLVAVPAGGELTQECAAALTAAGADAVVVEVTGDRSADCGVIAAQAAGRPATGVLSLLALDEEPASGFPGVPAGLAGTLCLVQALGDAGVSFTLMPDCASCVTTTSCRCIEI